MSIMRFSGRHVLPALFAIAFFGAFGAVAQHAHQGYYQGTLSLTQFSATTVDGYTIFIDGAGVLTDGRGLTGTVTAAGVITFTAGNPYNFNSTATITAGAITTTSTSPVFGFQTYQMNVTKSTATTPWSNLTSGLPANFANPVIGAGNGSTLYAATSDGIFRSTNNGDSWSQVASNTDTLPTRSLTRLASGRILRGGDTASWQNRVGNPVFYSATGAAPWTEATSYTPAFQGPGGTAGFIDFTLHSDGKVYAADLLSHGAWQSTDGSSWTAVGTGIPTFFGSAQKANAIVSQGSALIVATDTQGFFRSTNNGTSWSVANTGTSAGQGRHLEATASGSAAFGIMNNRVWKTTDGGANWSQAGAGLFEGAGGKIGSPADIAINGDAVYVYAGTGRIGESTDLGASWTMLDNGNLPKVPIGSFDDRFYASNGYLFVGTTLGLWRVNLSTVGHIPFPPTNVAISGAGAANIGGTLRLTATATGGTAPYSYEWYNGTTVISGQTGAILEITNFAQTDAGSYKVKAFNTSGSTTSGVLTVSVLPADVGYPRLSFTGAAPQFSTYAFMARKGSQILAGANSSFANNLVLFNADGTIDANWDLTVRPNGNIQGVAVDRRGRMFVAYSGTAFVGSTAAGPRIQRLLANGRPDPAFHLNNAGAEVSITYYGEKVAMAFQPDGKLLVGGDFTFASLGNVRVMRLLEDGTIDPSFSRSTSSTTGIPADFLVESDGSFLAATSTKGLVRFLANGTIDPTFVSPFDSSDSAVAIKRDGAGLLYLAGYLKRHDTANRGHRVVRLNASGTAFDPTFSNIATVGDNSIRAMALQDDGKVLITGYFNTIGGTAAYALARLGTNGLLDSTFSHGTHFNSLGVDVLVLPDGDIMSVGFYSAFDTLPVNGIIRLIGDPVDLAFVDAPATATINTGDNHTFTATSTGTSTISYAWRKVGSETVLSTTSSLTIMSATTANGGSYTCTITNASGSRTSAPAELVVLAAPEILVQPTGGTFYLGRPLTLSIDARGVAPLTYTWKRGDTTVGGNSPTLTIAAATAGDAGAYTCTVSNSLGTLTSTAAEVVIVPVPGSVDPAYAKYPVESFVFTVLQRNDKTYVGGSFGNVKNSSGTNTVRNNLARLDRNGFVDTNFLANTNSSVSRILEFSNGDILITGGFTTITDATGAKSRRNMARLSADGRVITSWFDTSSVLFSDPTAVVVLPDDSVLYAYASEVHRVLPDGSADPAFVSPFVGYQAKAFAVDNQGRILIVGNFANAGGVATHDYITRLTPTFQVDITFTPPVVNYTGSNDDISTIALDSQQRIIISGLFDTLDGATVPGIARLLPDGARDTAWTNPANTFHGGAYTLTVQPNDKILVGGNLGGNIKLQRLTTTGAIDSSFDQASGPEFAVRTLAQLPDGRAIAGGEFTKWGTDTTIKILTRIFTDPVPLAFSFQPAPVIALAGTPVTVNIEAAGTSAISYAWTKNGEPYANTSATLAFASPVVSDSGLYAVTITNTSGSLTSQFQVTIYDAPVILTHPASVTVGEGDTLTLAVSAVGRGTLSYQWYRNGENLTGASATTATYTKTGVLLSDAGTYTVIVSGTTAPAATSNPATVSTFLHPHNRMSGFTVSPAQLPSGFNLSTVAPFATLLRSAPDGSVFAGYRQANSYGSTLSGDGTIATPFVRYLANGTADTTFLTNITPSINAFGFPPNDLSFLPDGRFILSNIYPDASPLDGSRYTGPALFNANGTRDTAFAAVILGPLSVQNVVPLATRCLALPDGSFLIAGPFTTVNGTAVGRIAKLLPDGTLDPAFRAGTGFAHSASPTACEISRLRLLPDGRIAVTGFFDFYNGAPVGNIVTLYPDGSRDTTFATYPTVNAGIVRDVAPLSDGRLAIVGQFQTLYSAPGFGVTRQYAAVLFPDGTLDTSFPNVGPKLFTNNTHPHRVAVTANDLIVVAGNYSTNSPQTETIRFKIFDTAGVEATEFKPATGFAGFSPSLGTYDGGIYDMTVEPSGRILAGGKVGYYNGNTVNGFVRLNGYTVNPAFTVHPFPTIVNAGADANLTAIAIADAAHTLQWFKDDVAIDGQTATTLSLIAVDADDEGIYHAVATETASSRTTASRLAAVRVITTARFDYTPDRVSPVIGSFLRITPIVQPGANATFQWYHNDVLVEGATDSQFYAFPIGANLRGTWRLEVTNDHGTVSSAAITVTPVATPAVGDRSYTPTTGPNNQVYAVLPLSDDSILVGGAFTAFNDNTSEGRLTRVNADGSLNATFTPGTGLTGTGTNSVRRILALPNNRYLIAGEGLTTYNGTTVGNVFSLNADGTLHTAYGSVVPFSVYAAALQPDGLVVLGGQYPSNYSDTALRSKAAIARLNLETGALDTTFVTGTGFTSSSSGQINDIVILPDNRIAVGGTFNGYNGTTGVYGFVILNADGLFNLKSVNVPFNATVNDLAAYGDNQLLLAFGGGGGLMRVSTATGDKDNSFVSPPVSQSGNPFSLLVQSSGHILVGGDFVTNQFNALPQSFLIRVNSSGTVDTTFGGTIFSSTGLIRTIVPDAYGRFWLGGGFAHANNIFNPHNHTRGRGFGFDGTNYLTAPMLGSWYIENAGEANSTLVLSFLADGTYYLAEDGNSTADPSGQDGMERGTWTWNPTTGAFAATASVDTNGEWGLSPDSPTHITVNANILSIDGDLAPDTLSIPSTVTWTGTFTDSEEGILFESKTANIDSTNTFTGHNGDDDPGTGTYAYTKTTGNQGRITYTAVYTYAEGDTETENGVVNLTFTSATGGTFTSSGTWSANGFSGTFTNGAGNFSYQPAVAPPNQIQFTRVSGTAGGIVSGWAFTNAGQAQSSGVLSFLANGSYFLAEDGNSTSDPTGQDGMERGTYTWNASTGAFSSATTVDTNGEWGLNPDSIGPTVTISGDRMTIADDPTVIFRRISAVGSTEFLSEPADRTIDEGTTSTLKAVATGTGTLSYQWYLGDTGVSGFPVSGATTDTLTTPVLSATARYWLRVIDSGTGTYIDSGTIQISVITKPVITVVGNEITVEYGTENLNIRSGVTALDYLLGNISGDVTVNGAVDTGTLGDYTVSYTVRDSGGRTPNLPLPTRLYHIVDTTRPTISVGTTAITIPLHYPVTGLEGVTATDSHDGNLTSYISLGGNTIDVDTPGSFTLTYNVSDSSGNAAIQRSRTYTVVIDTTKPVISIIPPVVVLNVGDPLPVSLLDGVTATDNIDGSLTASIQVSGDTPNAAVAGTYRVVYTVTDFSGNRSLTAYRTYMVLIAPATDVDKDGLDDTWEVTHFGDLRFDGNDDNDGDGVLNDNEFRFGTNPRGYEITLLRGWNLVSLYHLPLNTAVTRIFSVNGDGTGGTVYAGTPWIWDPDKREYVEATNAPATGGLWLYAPVKATVTVDLDAQ